jgi:uncharacterized RDD family membrane protein YckC
MLELQQRKITIVTPEHVQLQFPTAGIGSRGAAHIIDAIIISVFNLLVFWLLYDPLMNTANTLTPGDGYAAALLIAASFVINWGYFLLMEAYSGGQTIGKKLLRLKVIQDNGTPLTFLSAVIRNLLRVFDFLPVFYFVGMLVSFFHGYDKRIGDMVAGTIVIRLEPVQSHRRLKRRKKILSQWTVGFDDLAIEETDKQTITREEWQVLSAFIDRLPSLTEAKRQELAQSLSAYFIERLNWDNRTPELQFNPIGFLLALYELLREDWELESHL